MHPILHRVVIATRVYMVSSLNTAKTRCSVDVAYISKCIEKNTLVEIGQFRYHSCEFRGSPCVRSHIALLWRHRGTPDKQEVNLSGR